MRQRLQQLDGRYELHDVLGEGGMATVYKGVDRNLWGRPVAIKVLAPSLVADDRALARFRREALAAASLAHPNCVAVYDAGSDGDVHYIVTEYVDGGSLADRLAGGPVDIARAVRIGSAVCRALSAAHDQGLVHRDVKPANVLLTADGEVKVADFGIARVLAEQPVTETATVLGTAAYMSPEQARGGEVDARSDLYALACVIYEMLAGRPPFVGDNQLSVLYRHVTEAPVALVDLRPEVSHGLHDIVMRALAKNPAERFASARAMLDALERVVAPDPDADTLVPAVVPQPATEHERWPPRPRRVAAALGILVIAGASAGVLLRGPGREATPPPRPGGGVFIAPATTEDNPRVASVAAGVDGVAMAVTEGLQARLVSAEAAGRLMRRLGDVLHEYGDGDLEDTLKKVDDLDKEVRDQLDSGEIAPERARSVRAAIRVLEDAIRADPPVDD